MSKLEEKIYVPKSEEELAKEVSVIRSEVERLKSLTYMLMDIVVDMSKDIDYSEDSDAYASYFSEESEENIFDRSSAMNINSPSKNLQDNNA
jgi:hypothetical protein